MGKPESESRIEQLPSLKDIFPLSNIAVNKGIVALRDSRPKSRFILQERDYVEPVFDLYLQKYLRRFQSIQSDFQQKQFPPLVPSVDNESFFAGAMLVHNMIRNQVNLLNEQSKKKLKREPTTVERIELPYFEDAERLLESEIDGLYFWKAGAKETQESFGTTAIQRINQLSKKQEYDGDYFDNPLGYALYCASSFCEYPDSFNTGAVATYFAMRNAVEANRSFEEIPMLK